MIPSKNVVQFSFVNEQLIEMQISLIFDNELNAYRGCVNASDFKFPLLVNLTKIQTMNKCENKNFELLFFHNDKDSVSIFLYEEQQKMYSARHKNIRLNEQSIYEILYKHDCDEATLYFDGNNFEYMYQKDKSSKSTISSFLSFINSLPARILYTLLISYKAYTVISWIYSLNERSSHPSS